MDIFKVTHEEAIDFLADLEKSDKLHSWLKENYPQYIDGDCIYKFTLLDDLDDKTN